jgi:hypothetical protein
MIGPIFDYSVMYFEELVFDASPDEDLHLMLASPGGDGEVAVRLVRAAQTRCRHLTVIVPNQAKSAATLLALGAHEILMGPTSDLGPVDPQFPFGEYDLVSAKDIIAAVERALKDVAERPDTYALHSAMLSEVNALKVEQARSALARRPTGRPSSSATCRCVVTAARGSSAQGPGLEGAAGAESAVLAEIVEHGGQAYAKHLPADVPEQLRHEDSADAGEAGVLIGEAGAVGAGFEPVGDQCHLAAVAVDPRVPQQPRLIRVEHLTVDDAVPARLGLGDQPELRARDGSEAFRPAARTGRGPQRDQGRVGQCTPDLGRGMGIVTHDTDLAHENSSGSQGQAAIVRSVARNL